MVLTAALPRTTTVVMAVAGPASFCVPGAGLGFFSTSSQNLFGTIQKKEALTAVDPGPREVKCLIEGHAQQATGPGIKPRSLCWGQRFEFFTAALCHYLLCLTP